MSTAIATGPAVAAPAAPWLCRSDARCAQAGPDTERTTSAIAATQPVRNRPEKYSDDERVAEQIKMRLFRKSD
jgi:hypothetical protein